MAQGEGAEAGYTLIETLVVVAMIAILVGAGAESLTEQPAQLSTAIAQFSAMLDETRALAAANAGQINVGDGTSVAASTGATLWVAPDPADPNYTVATLYWYRPIKDNPCGGCVEPARGTPALRLHVGVLVTTSQGETSNAFAIFIAPSSHLSVATQEFWGPGQGALFPEPPCNAEHGPELVFTLMANRITKRLSCNGATLES